MVYTAVWWRIPGEVLTEQYISMVRIITHNYCNKFNMTLVLPSFPGGAADIWFSLNGTTYQNNSVITLEDIGERGDALLCITDQPNCCRPHYTGENGQVIGNWFFPNGTRVPSKSTEWNLYRDRGLSVVRLHRRRGGDEGLYRCEIPNILNTTQSIYIGVYTASTGEPPLTDNMYKWCLGNMYQCRKNTVQIQMYER